MFDLAHASPLALAAIGCRQMPVEVTPDDQTGTAGAETAGAGMA